MVWRIDVDESKYSDAELIAWELVLPWKHLPILDSDRGKILEAKRVLEKIFSKGALAEAANKIRGGR